MLAVKNTWIVALLLGLAFAGAWIFYPTPTIDFNTQVKPIINQHCISCHGGVRRKAGFSLLFRADAMAPTESGKPAIIPGKPEQSEFIRRLTLGDPEERMPYRHDPLPEKDIEILRTWIRQGAPWGEHWAYRPVREMPLAAIENQGWARNDIDLFIADKWKEKNLAHASEADKATLLRRVSLDLTGLPPARKTARQFLNDPSDRAYENLVDALLASPRYGERWTALWLDLARYADTKGYERDDNRSIWRYRDWLIRAFNEDKPYNEFITEQLAGDLFPKPTDDQRIATAFHRNTMTNDEGGTENEEFRTAAVMDRVNTTWEVLMGTTFACTQCHSHPYDPFRNDEYYKFMAFFNNSRDEDSYADYPLLRTYAPKDSMALITLEKWIAENVSPQSSASVDYFLKMWQPSINSLTSDQFVNSELSDTKWLIFRNHARARLQKVDLTGKNELICRLTSWSSEGIWKIHLDTQNGPVIAVNKPANAKGEWVLTHFSILPSDGVHDLYLTYENPTLTNPSANGVMFDWFYFTTEFPGKGKPGRDSAEARFWALMKADVECTPVMLDNPPSMKRKTFVFERGNWLVKGKEVTPGTPHSLLSFPADAPPNRLGLAQWMTDPGNPLTSRTIVNRMWEQIFGAGLAETLEDLGTQGSKPTHPELLDHLAYQFMHSDKWSLKALLKKMVMSATYRQDSHVTNESLEKDQYNKYYARGARVRLSAEEVRDQTLAVAGLLSDKMYGPSVMPWQPKGIWSSPWNGQDWKLSKGENRYRRAIYTFWKRTSPYPSMMMFDGTARELCSARRIRTNTPLQALVTLNDSTYVEATRAFAGRIQHETNGTITDKISLAYAEAIGQPVTAEKLDVLLKLYIKTASTYRRTAFDRSHEGTDEALAVVAGVILNLDEFITRN